MADRESKTDLGSVRIHNEVIASIASLATLEVEGVAGLATGIFPQKVSAFLGKVNLTRVAEQLQKRGFNRSIKVDTKDDEVRIDVSVNVKYGVDIPHVSKRVQESIKKAIEQMTGLGLAEVNVNIQGVQSLRPGADVETNLSANNQFPRDEKEQHN